ncbi:MAG TPA: DUF5808 domain-containing protein [Terriglobia bacterium]|nr:DUF5808 domain-containing protein [Terriglobia bacterium]
MPAGTDDARPHPLRSRINPALFVEKRFGIGYTLNFGRPGSWFMLTALLLVPVVIALVVKWGGK